jgi:hypothetical protein
MAAKKKTTTPKLKSENDGKGTKAQVDAFKKTKGSIGATAAFTNKGQKATGLRSLTPAEVAARKANESKPKTRIVKDISGLTLRGSGTPLNTSMAINPLNKSQVVNAALTATTLRGSGQVAKYVASKAGGRVAEAAFKASTKGFEATGAGGKVKNVMTPFGKTLGSTRIGSSAQQTASMGNLEIAKIKEAARAGADIGGQVIRGVNKAGKVVRATTIAGVVGKGLASKVKKKK